MLQTFSLLIFLIFFGLPSLAIYMLQPVIIRVTAGQSLQAAIDSAPAGAIIEVQAGATFNGPFRLRNKRSTSVTTIRISDLSAIPPEGVLISSQHFAAMPKLIHPCGGSSPLIETDAGAGPYKLIGLELSVQYIEGRECHPSFLVDLSNGGDNNPSYGEFLSHDITFDRVHAKGKFNDARFAFVFNGVNQSLINSWISEFANGAGVGDSAGVWLGVGPGPYTIDNNHIEAGMWQIFTGGADGDSPNFGTVGSGTASSVTLTNMQGTLPAVGDLISFAVTSPSPTIEPWLAQTSYSLGQRLYRHTSHTQPVNRPPSLFYVTKAGVSGSTEPDFFNAHENRPVVDGTVEWKQEVTGFQIGRVTGVNGSTFSLEPAMPQGLVLPPITGSRAKWNGNQPSDIRITRNHFFRPGHWAASGAQNKGMFQFKAARRVLVEGNYFESEVQYPGLLGLSAGNQGGSAPWSTVSHLDFINNRVRHLGTIANITLFDTFGKTSTPGSNINISNNLMTEMGGQAENEVAWFLLMSNANGVRAVHNTVVNNGKLMFAYGPAQSNFILRDNILTYNASMFCELGEPIFGKCFPGHIVGNNAITQVPSERRAEFPATNFFPATHANVGYVNLGGQAVSDYALRFDSSYRGKASDGKDIGVDTAVLNAALSGTLPIPIPTPTPSPQISPTPTSLVGVNGYVYIDGARAGGVRVEVQSPTGPVLNSAITREDGYFEFNSVPLQSVLSVRDATQVVTAGGTYMFSLTSASPTPTPPQPSPTVTPSPTPTSTPTPAPTPTPSPSPTPTQRAAWFPWPATEDEQKRVWVEKSEQGWWCAPVGKLLWCRKP